MVAELLLVASKLISIVEFLVANSVEVLASKYNPAQAAIISEISFKKSNLPGQNVSDLNSEKKRWKTLDLSFRTQRESSKTIRFSERYGPFLVIVLLR